MTLTRTWISYPDDPDNAYSVLRAWDRHLLSVGLLPIGTSDSSKVGPILVNPNGTREYIAYGFDSRGFLTSWRQVLQEEKLRKEAGSTSR